MSDKYENSGEIDLRPRNFKKIDPSAISDLFADIGGWEDRALALRMKRTKQALSRLAAVAFELDRSASALRMRARRTAFLVDSLRYGAGRRICSRAGSMIGGCGILQSRLDQGPDDWLLTLADTQELLSIVENAIKSEA